MPKRRFPFLLLLLGCAGSAFAQESASLIFLPPPMDDGGTISLGIYAKGTLVRVLHREAPLDDFKQGENGLITRWDLQDGAGQPVSPGNYDASGWMVGNLSVEGVAFHGNDWIKEESPRFVRVVGLKGVGRDEVQVTLKTADGAEATLGWKLAREGDEPPASGITATIENGEITIHNGAENIPVMLREGEMALACAAGYNGRVWAIVQMPSGREIRAYSSDGEFLGIFRMEKRSRSRSRSSHRNGAR